MSARTPTPWPLVALFTAGYLAAYLLPTTVGRLDAGLPLSATQAGAVGSVLLLSSASAGFLLASRVDRFGPRRLARAGLLLAALGYGTAALSTAVPLVVAGAIVGGFGSGTATAVAATGIAGRRDPHRVTTLGLLGVSGLAGALYLTIPHLGPAHGVPLAAIACTALLALSLTGRLPARTPAAHTLRTATPLPHRRSGLLLAGAMLFWSLAQNSLWGVSGRIGLTQAGLTEVKVGAVFAVALGAGLLGTIGAGALGPRLGRALPIGLGTALIAGCIALSAAATDLTSFAAGEIAWNALYPVVLSYVIGLAASMDTRGRWAVLVGSASSLGTACGPLTGSLLSARAGYPAMGTVLAAGLLLVGVPMTLVALRPRRTTQIVEIPLVEMPVMEIPTVEIPVMELPVVKTPVANELMTPTPAVDDPFAEIPAAVGRFARIPVVEISVPPIPVADNACAEIAVVDVVEFPLEGVPAQREAYGTAGPRHTAATVSTPGPVTV
ncbi:MFS transporter [Streptomyces rhizosphaerihabitans]|uniref:MFS transporter n=1 Tax=Streptomyces rhizosphaerihabitans TaxID=1266770 RepID=UPI0021C1D24E|nr:MFS transporter [Streptomyces rhizosphaerihabitans]MCT9004225.1 MFS transporter [Streptomyces rhizosphaerihabitans]